MNNNNELDSSINLDALKTQISNTYSDEETPVVGNDWMNKISHDTEIEAPSTALNSAPIATDPVIAPQTSDEEMIKIPDESEYNGSGIIINNTEFQEVPEDPLANKVFTGINGQTESYIADYMKDMDNDIEELKSNVENSESASEMNNDDDDEESEDEPGMTADEFDDKYNEAVVIIDKTNYGKIINFTDEEREKLEKVKKIKLEEVETVSLESIKTKKIKKKDVDKLLKRVNNVTTTNIVLPISGYSAVMKGCSAYELISLLDGNKNALLNAQQKWGLIHDKIESTSIGNMDYNEFLLNTAASDYDNFIYGILCSTYPDNDKMPLKCEKCKKEFDHEYSVSSLIRVEQIGEKLQEVMMNVVDSSVSEELAKATHEASLVKTVQRLKLPASGIIAEIYVQSAYDLINKSIADLSKNEDSKYVQAAVLSTLVNSFLVEDTDEPGTYFEIDTAHEISKVIYNLSEIDVMIIRKKAEELLDGMNISYGPMNIKCPHCGHYTASLELNLESILFYRYRQAISTELE